VVRQDGGGWKIEVADDWQRPMWDGSSSRGTGEPCLGDTSELSLQAYGGFALATSPFTAALCLKAAGSISLTTGSHDR